MSKNDEITVLHQSGQSVAGRKGEPSISSDQRLKDLQSLVGICFELLSDYSMVSIAYASGLSVGTLYRLQSMEFTLAVRYNTIERLSMTAGLTLSWEQGRPYISLED